MAQHRNIVTAQKSGILVMKFGGTSIGSREGIEHFCSIVNEANKAWQNVAVVVSALSGVTNQLLESVTLAISGDIQPVQAAAEGIRDRHSELLQVFIPDQIYRAQIEQEIYLLVENFLNLCQAVSILGEATPRARDAVAALGERLSVRILAGILSGKGLPAQIIEATQFMVTDDHYQSAYPVFVETQAKTKEVLLPLFTAGVIPVITGFIGATREGVTTTLGRGGSDYSAALIGACLPADEVWIWTDVDGVMSADPRIVVDACTIPELTFKEIGELAYFGAKVLHPKTIRPVIEAEVKLRIRNTYNPTHPGTMIVHSPFHNDADRDFRSPEGVIKAVTSIEGQTLITLEGRGMLGVTGVAARTFAAVARTGTSIPLITQASSEQSICFAAPMEAAGTIVNALEQEFWREIDQRDIDRVWASDPVVILTIVGEGMRHTPGVAGKIFTALGTQQVNVIAIAQGSSEVSVSLVVAEKDLRAGLLALHKLVQFCSEAEEVKVKI
jgi:bifunctional aspartokinase / homoserine dehydrogenase 1